ncbi:hypothetical protein L1887_56926 [Cichorium endivia]|nr:hypothetical protein L1887_56920 [Cichorium endivia]KAI3480920.1 hypothetical protein L1887_56926 [Cichorium endivia]
MRTRPSPSVPRGHRAPQPGPLSSYRRFGNTNRSYSLLSDVHVRTPGPEASGYTSPPLGAAVGGRSPQPSRKTLCPSADALRTLRRARPGSVPRREARRRKRAAARDRRGTLPSRSGCGPCGELGPPPSRAVRHGDAGARRSESGAARCRAGAAGRGTACCALRADSYGEPAASAHSGGVRPEAAEPAVSAADRPDGRPAGVPALRAPTAAALLVTVRCGAARRRPVRQGTVRCGALRCCAVRTSTAAAVRTFSLASPTGTRDVSAGRGTARRQRARPAPRGAVRRGAPGAVDT